MKEQIPISIIMPAYNCEKYISDAVKSVRQQTYQNWELIIIEDCSTDNTWRLIQTFRSEKIRIYQNERNLGVAKTRNYGVKIAKSEWIAFLDSDDLWAVNKLDRQVCMLKKNASAKLIFTGSAFIKENGEVLQHVMHVPYKISRGELLKQNVISCSSVLVRKSILENYPMPEVQKLIHEDFAVWLQILAEIPFAYGIDEPLMIYRVSYNSKSGNKLKSAKMNWNTYKYVNINLMERSYYMTSYLLKGLIKYIQLRV